jgi:hypothetical protein
VWALSKQATIPLIKLQVTNTHLRSSILSSPLTDYPVVLYNPVCQGMNPFFSRMKEGELPEFSRFQGKTRYDSFKYAESGYSVESEKLVLSKIGYIKIKL